MSVGFREKRTNKEKKGSSKFIFVIIVILAVVAFVVVPLLVQQVQKTDELTGNANARSVYSAAVTALEICKESDDPAVVASIVPIDGEVAATMLLNHKDDPSNAFKYEVANILGPSFAGNIYVALEGDTLLYSGWENGTGGLRYGYEE